MEGYQNIKIDSQRTIGKWLSKIGERKGEVTHTLVGDYKMT